MYKPNDTLGLINTVTSLPMFKSVMPQILEPIIKNKLISKTNNTQLLEEIIKQQELWKTEGRILHNVQKTKKMSIVTPTSISWLKLFKRWWFIKPTNPKTKINIPNIDFPYETQSADVMGLLQHPIQEFKGQGTVDIDVSMEIMIELVNIVMHWWHHSTNELFNGMGDETLQGMMHVMYNWYNLATSQEEIVTAGCDADYKRVFRWIRWEVEKVFFEYKVDYMNWEKEPINNKLYNGNYYMGHLIENLLEYLKFHHYMIVPLYKSTTKMSQMRAIVKDVSGNWYDPQSDIMTSLPDKIKGIREYIIDEDDK
jgi:hypothetical protein